MLFSATIAAAVLAFVPTTFANKVLDDANGNQVIINNNCGYPMYMNIVPGAKSTWPNQPANDTGTVKIESGATVYTPYIWTDDDCTAATSNSPQCPGVAYKFSKDPNSNFQNDILHFEYGIHTDTWTNNADLMGKSLLWYDLSLVNCAANSPDIVCNGYDVTRCPGYEKGWALYFDNPDSKCTPYACDAGAAIDQCKWNAYFWSAPTEFGVQTKDPNNMCDTAYAYQHGNLHFDMCKDSLPPNAGTPFAAPNTASGPTATNTCFSTMKPGGTYVTGATTVVGNTAAPTGPPGAAPTTTTTTPPNGAPTTTTTTLSSSSSSSSYSSVTTTTYTDPSGQYVTTTATTTTVTQYGRGNGPAAYTPHPADGGPIQYKREVQFTA